jgi:hypothetical protein
MYMLWYVMMHNLSCDWSAAQSLTCLTGDAVLISSWGQQKLQTI